MKLMLAVSCAAVALAGVSAAEQPAMAPMHNMTTPAQLVWGPAPPGLPAGAQVAVLAGDPGGTGPFTLRAKLPAGYRVPPHWHPTDEHVTVLSGAVAMGMGETIDEKAMMALPVGGFAAMAPNQRHYLVSKSGATIQVHGTGPFAITYVNPKDDPRTAAPKM